MLGVIDNDVLIKLACYRLLAASAEMLGGATESGILGSARFVVRSRFKKDSTIQDATGASTEFEAYLQDAIELEPSPAEIQLATEIEELAMAENAQLDSGESQLCAMAVIRGCSYVLTGDKRAIEGLETILPGNNQLPGLSSKVVCLEQILLALWSSVGPADLKVKVCAERLIDKALSICMSCTNTADPTKSGLLSYVGDLQQKAPTVMNPATKAPLVP